MSVGIMLGLGAVVLAWILWTRRRARRIEGDFRYLVAHMSQGDFSKRLLPFMQGDFAALALEMNRMVETLGKTMTQLRGEKDLVANVSHDLKTPLTAIRGYAETLRQGALDDRAVALRFLEKIETNATRLQHLVEDILRLAQLDAGRVPMRGDALNVVAVAEQVLEGNRERAAAQGIRLIFHSAVPEIIAQLDRAPLEQVLANLLDNAVNYTPSGGEVRLGVSQSPQGFAVCVEDTGIGISEEELPHIFERFYRVDKARSKHSGGSGLGLAIVKQIVKSFGGTVSVSSVLNRGSCFMVELPLRFPSDVTQM